ncbi:CMD domain protein, Avi_7170 family [Rhizobium sp. RU35A]|uniref:CMD domain protein n=1 Tax=Rhizobium sp. RU35A TaxID=1907414 RepID=UPI000954FE5E|nr:CMD domain protein [Rhizobium sp. RU35A]SIQ42346.1 CMD domain protein, Avi_7170 family [Rhizobium sp. RU35A]
MTTTIPDIIDHLAGIASGSAGAVLRARRPVTREGAQASWVALFAPADAGDFPVSDRFALAAFVSILHGQAAISAFYADHLNEQANGTALRVAVEQAAAAGLTNGPYGHYPAGPLLRENRDGLIYQVADAERAVLGEKLSTLLEHAHLLVLHPRDAKPEALSKLLAAGWNTTSIVTASQLVAFLAFQIRVIAGLKVLNAA